MSLADRSMRIYNLLLVQYSSDLYCSTTSTTTRSVYNEKRGLTGPNSGYLVRTVFLVHRQVKPGSVSFARYHLRLKGYRAALRRQFSETDVMDRKTRRRRRCVHCFLVVLQYAHVYKHSNL